MTSERVDELLSKYRENTGRCAHLKEAQKELEQQYNAIKATHYATMLDCGAKWPDGMPHGTFTGNPTEQKAMKIMADNYMSDEMRAIQAQIAENRKELAEKAVDIAYVDAWLTGLNERDRWIINQQVIDKVPWRDIAILYQQKYFEARTKRSLQTIRDMAMEKVYQIAK